MQCAEWGCRVGGGDGERTHFLRLGGGARGAEKEGGGRAAAADGGGTPPSLLSGLGQKQYDTALVVALLARVLHKQEYQPVGPSGRQEKPQAAIPFPSCLSLSPLPPTHQPTNPHLPLSRRLTQVSQPPAARGKGERHSALRKSDPQPPTPPPK